MKTLAAAILAFGLHYGGTTPYTVTLDRVWQEGGSRRLKAEAGPVVLRAHAQPAEDEAAAQRRLGEWQTRLLGQFEVAAGYPGMITREIEVPASLRPKPVPGLADGRAIWIVPATERLTFGAGAEDLVFYISVVSQRWCPEAKKVVELTLYYPKKGFQEKTALAEEARFTCGRATEKP